MSARRRLPIARGLVTTLAVLSISAGAHAATRLVVLTGLAGESGYEDAFARQSDGFAAAFEGAGAQVVRLAGASAGRAAVEARLDEAGRALGPDDRLVLVYVGHGTYDGRNFRFNVPGPDFTAEDLAAWLDLVPAWQLVVLTSSASGAAIAPLTSNRRSLVTATRSGEQSNVTVFGDYLVEALGTDSADLDKDRELSLQEAFDYAAAAVARHYESRRLMATEHPQLVNPRGLFVLASLEAPSRPDPTRVAALTDRDRVEAEIERLKEQKSELSPEAYFGQLQQLLLELALIEERLDGEGPP